MAKLSDDTVIKQRNLPGVAINKVTFPAETQDSFVSVYFYRECNRKGIPKGKFLNCELCNSTSLLSSCEQRYEVRAIFAVDGGKVRWFSHMGILLNLLHL